MQLNETPHVKQIYYLLENPELDFLPRNAIPRLYDIWGLFMQDTTMDRSLYQMRMHQYRELVYAKSADFANVHIIDVEPYICEENTCYAFKDGNFLYADDDHYSVFGSNFIAQKIENILFEE